MMTIKELKEAIKDYPDDQFVHIRIWYNANPHFVHKDMIADKVQQGVDGSLLVTGSVDMKEVWARMSERDKRFYRET